MIFENLKTADDLLKNSYIFGDMSDLAYNSSTEIREKLYEKYGVDYSVDVEYFEDDARSTQGFCLKTENNILISFRGTEPSKLKDWMTDLKFRQKDIKLGEKTYKVHSGFLQSLEEVWDHIFRWVDIRMTNDKKIWITGHSLGGALSSMALLKFLDTKWKDQITGIYTYGAPRSVGEELASYLNEEFSSKIFRFINDEDIVPHLPPDGGYTENYDYSHYGTRIHFKDEGFTIDRTLDKHVEDWNESKRNKDNIISSIILKIVDFTDIKEKIGDHSIKKYKKCCLRKNLFHIE